jgi:MraZ protein
MFLGNYIANIDGKGRINIPSRYQEVLEKNYGNNLILSLNKDCIVVYPQSEWTILEEKWRELPSLKREVQDFYRLFYGRASECSMKHGRILVPPTLRGQAGLNKEVVIVGVLRMMEVWDKGRWEKFMAEKEGQFEELGDKLSEM